MDAKELLTNFAKDLQEAFSLSITDINVDEAVNHIEKTFYPEAMKILQKDISFFDTERTLFGVNLSELWAIESITIATKDAIWKHIQLCTLASFMHGDMKEKIGSIMDIVKSMWGGKGDDISKILDDSESEGRIKEFIDFVLETRIVKIFMEIVEQFDVKDVELNLENPEELMDMLKNPEHPYVQKIMGKVQGIIKEKIRSGAISQHEIVREVEAIKAKVTSIFGDVFNDALGIKRGEMPSTVMLGNSPEARRQRMLARLQKKVRDKNSR